MTSAPRTLASFVLLSALARCMGGPVEGFWSGIGILDRLDATSGIEGAVVVLGLQVGQAG